jgi:hypothetical protein
MSNTECWIIENYTYRRTREPQRELPFAVSIHNHSNHSIETMGFLNEVVCIPWMRPFRSTLQAAFGLGGIESLNYNDIDYLAPLTPEEVLRTETAAAVALGFDGVHLGITDHDEVNGSLELRQAHPELAKRIALGEELSIHFDGYLFHIGITGMQAETARELHTELQQLSEENRLDELFERLKESGYLVIFNHPLVPWGSPRTGGVPAPELLKRYGWAIHALEYNGMRSKKENDAVLELAREVRKPVIGGGDSHLLLASSVLSLTHAATYEGFADEVRDGRGTTLIAPEFFAPLGWKIFLRVLYFMGHYRRMGRFRGEPVGEMLRGRTVLLDPVGVASRGFLRMADALHLIR